MDDQIIISGINEHPEPSRKSPEPAVREPSVDLVDVESDLEALISETESIIETGENLMTGQVHSNSIISGQPDYEGSARSATTITNPGRSAIGVTYAEDGSSILSDSSVTTSQILVRGAVYEEALRTDGGIIVDLETCLAINQAYQELIDDFIDRARGITLDKIHQRKETLKKQLSASSQGNLVHKRNPVLPFLPPYFKDKAGMSAPLNKDKRRKLDRGEYDPLVREPRPFTKVDCDNLTKNVRENLIESRLIPLTSRKELLQDKIRDAGQEVTFRLIEAWREELKTIDRQIGYAKNESNERIFDGNYDQVDWHKIAHFDFQSSRTAVECQLKWQNELAPKWSQNKWTEVEMKKLIRLVEKGPKNDKMEQHNWEMIARKMNTNRTSFQCFQKYQSELNENRLRKQWTDEESNRLFTVVETIRNGAAINWTQVAYYMEGRNQQQCMMRWKRCEDTAIKKGRWNEKEDLNLMFAVSKYGAKEWSKVAQLVPGRTDSQCRERWVNVLDRSNKSGDWTPEEDDQLRVGLETFSPGRWADISNLIPGRNPNACKVRYRALHKMGLTATQMKKPKSTRDDDAIFVGNNNNNNKRENGERYETETKLKPHQYRNLSLEKRKKKVYEKFEQLSGLPPGSTRDEEELRRGIMCALPADIRNIVQFKLNAIKLKHGYPEDCEELKFPSKTLGFNKNNRKIIARKRREQTCDPLPSTVIIEDEDDEDEDDDEDDDEVINEDTNEVKNAEESTSSSSSADIISEKSRLEMELARAVANRDTLARTDRKCKALERTKRATRNLYAQALHRNVGRSSVTLPPCMGSLNAYRNLLEQKKRLAKIAASIYAPSTSQTSPSTSSRKRAKKKITQPKTPESCDIAVELPADLLKTNEYALLKRRMEALFAWPGLLSKVGAGISSTKG